MLYRFRFDQFRWIDKTHHYKHTGDYFVAFYLDLPQYGKEIIATNGELCKFDNEILMYDKNRWETL